MSGDKESSLPAITSLKPLKTERTQMIAAVAIAMPQIDTMDMALYRTVWIFSTEDSAMLSMPRAFFSFLV